MRNYIIRRILLVIPTLLLVSVFIFVVMRVVPGDVAAFMLDEATNVREVERIRERLGLNRPLFVQYFDWLRKVPRLDFGDSFRSDRPVLDEIRPAAPVSANLAVYSLVITAILGIPIGVIAALRQDTIVDYILRVFGIVGLAMPNFWLGIMILFVMSIAFHYFPKTEWINPFTDPWGNLKQMILPGIVLGTAQVALLSRMTRSTLLEVLREDYVRTAHAKGLPGATVTRRHALRNSLLPVVTLAGIQFGALLGGAVVTENVFNLPGLGRLMVDALLTLDYPIIEVCVVLAAVFVVFVNLIVDITYAYLDPRIRYD